MARIKKHNAEAKDGKHKWFMGVNQFTDMTDEEFSLKFGTFTPTSLAGVPVHNGTINIEDLPDKLNWVSLGYVTGVKDQRTCGSCWAFSATGAIEGAWKRKTSTLLTLSPQLYVDCDQGSYGCNGGYMETAFDFTRNHGAELLSDYPYNAKVGDCKFDPEKVVAKTKTYHTTIKSEAALQQALVEAGPISVGLNADGFKSYSHGVFHGNCHGDINHALLLVGYGLDQDGQEYWLIKNSWGKWWGEDGYIRLARNYNRLCHISEWATYPEA